MKDATGLLQPGVDKNSKELAILILGFDDITAKTIYRPFWWNTGAPVWKINRAVSWGFFSYLQHFEKSKVPFT